MAQMRTAIDIPIFHKFYDLYKLLHSYHSTIPKLARYTIWQECEGIALTLLKTVIKTGYLRDEDRTAALYTVSQDLDLLKVFVRLAKETVSINNQQYITIQTLLQDAGKMIGGWIKSVTGKEPLGENL